MNDKQPSAQKVCSKCVLPESFPGIQFNNQGICNFCLEYDATTGLTTQKSEYLKKYELLIAETKQKISSYDLLMCYSGGKDSTYTLKLLKERSGLRIIAVTYDNGFVSPQAKQNILNVVEALGVDHLYFKPNFDVLKKLFRFCSDHDLYSPKAMERASAICTTCMGIIKYSSMRMAIEKKIPIIAFGWSPGQTLVTASILKNNSSMVRMMQGSIYNPLFQLAGHDIDPYFLREEHFAAAEFPYYVHPLAFYDYNEDDIYREIATLGWTPPLDVDANSTNCMLNSFANVVHKKRLGFHPYANELAQLVRQGHLTRDEALNRLDRLEDPNTIAIVENKLRGEN